MAGTAHFEFLNVGMLAKGLGQSSFGRLASCAAMQMYKLQ